MIYRGTVKDGVVKLADGVMLPDGTHVKVEPLPSPGADTEPSDDAVFAMSDLAVDTGIEDLSTNIDHYLYGHPKATPDG